MPPDGHNRIKITPEIIAAMHSHIQRTGIWPATLLRGKRNELPEGLNSSHILSWLNGRTITARTDHLNYVIRLWEYLPDATDIYYMLTDEKQKDLRQKFQAVGLSPKRLFDGRQDAPEGFNWERLHHFLSRAKKIRKDHYNYIVAICEAHKGTGYVKITQSIQDKIKSEICRTGKSAGTVLRLAGKKKPANITAVKVRIWLKGDVKRAEKNAIDWLLAQFAKYPDKAKKAKRKYKGRYDWTSKASGASNHSSGMGSMKPIKDEELRLLQQYRQQHGLLPTKIFSAADTLPPTGLNQYMVSNWLSGRTKRVDPEHVKWVLKHCRELEASIKEQIRLEAINLRKEIIAVSAKTALTADAAYEHLEKRKSQLSFTLSQLKRWMSGEVDLIPPEKIKPILDFYVAKQQSPSIKNKSNKRKDIRIGNHRSLTGIELEKLRYYRDKYGILPGKIFKIVEVPPPADLSPYKISSWLNGGTKTADPELVHWVLKRCEEYEKLHKDR